MKNNVVLRLWVQAVAALLNDRNSSAIVTLKSSGLDRLKDLDGKRYASYAARFEGRIVQKMIMSDGKDPLMLEFSSL